MLFLCSMFSLFYVLITSNYRQCLTVTGRMHARHESYHYAQSIYYNVTVLHDAPNQH